MCWWVFSLDAAGLLLGCFPLPSSLDGVRPAGLGLMSGTSVVVIPVPDRAGNFEELTMISELFGLATREHVISGSPWSDGGLDELVVGSAPRRFAVVQRCGSGFDFRVAAWGMVFGERAEVVTVEGRRLTVSQADSVVSGFDRSPAFTAHLVWVDPESSTPRCAGLGFDDGAPVVDVPFDGVAGVGIRVEPWRTANGHRFVGLMFASSMDEQSHDLTRDQAVVLRDALTEIIARMV